MASAGVDPYVASVAVAPPVVGDNSKHLPNRIKVFTAPISLDLT